MRSLAKNCSQTRKLEIKPFFSAPPRNASTPKRGSRAAPNAEEFYFGVICPRLLQKKRG